MVGLDGPQPVGEVDASDSSEIGTLATWPARWLPDANVMVPISAGTSTSGIHIVTVRSLSNGQ